MVGKAVDNRVFHVFPSCTLFLLEIVHFYEKSFKKKKKNAILGNF
jgi:hypothetical protein